MFFSVAPGFVGGLAGGWLSDKLLDGRRGPIMCVFILLCAPLALAYQALMDIDGDSVDVFGVSISKLIALQVTHYRILLCFGVLVFRPSFPRRARNQ